MGSPLSSGTKLGRYEIRSQLGAGGMGEVYLARDTRLERNVALKVLPTDVAGDRHRMSRFEQEAKAASALNHPNILTMRLEIAVRDSGRVSFGQTFRNVLQISQEAFSNRFAPYESCRVTSRRR